MHCILPREHPLERENFIVDWLASHHRNLHLQCSQPELFASIYLAGTQISEASNSVVVVENDDAAWALKRNLKFLSPNLHCPVLPTFDVSPFSGLYPSSQDVRRRLHWFSACHHPKPGQILIAPLSALLSASISVEQMLDCATEWSVGDDIPDDIHTWLQERGYNQTPLVEDIGSYSFRGGILDIFSPASELPIRVELFGEQIESLRSFDPQGQRTIEVQTTVLIVPAREFLFRDEQHIQATEAIHASPLAFEEKENWISQLRHKHHFDGIEYLLPFCKNKNWAFEHLPTNAVYWFMNPLDTERTHVSLLEKWKEEALQSPSIFPAAIDYFANYKAWATSTKNKKIVLSSQDFEDVDAVQDKKILEIQTKSITIAKEGTFTDRAQSLVKKCQEWTASGYKIFFSIATENQFRRLKPFLQNADLEVSFYEDLPETEPNKNQNISFYTGHFGASGVLVKDKLVFLNFEKFFSIKRTRSKKNKTQLPAISLIDLNSGDYAIHSIHGMCQYNGLTTLNLNGVEAEFLELSFKGKDKLFLPIYRINQVNKYSGGGANPSLDKLGGNKWETTKSKVKQRLREIALDLLRIYSERKAAKKAPFNVETSDISNFEATFPFTETNDQLGAIEDVKKDMSSDKPMDRLVCGDVGFGKTEVAMRAAFIAASQGKQVAILAPTTILTFQHFETFKKRFAGWPLKIGLLNRFITNQEKKKSLALLKNGELDIIIGTHRLISKDIEFKNLGLLVIDEEQKFGVVHKEKIRKLKHNVDTLTLSATPIPRTLNMSLLGIRDLSLINTPPKDRLPTRTFLLKSNKETIRKSIESEVQRGGQVFFLHNRVQSIYSVTDELRQLLPGVRISIGHGQMKEKELENTMVNFFNKKIDVLVCTTIIESGMDIPNANTIFIDNAQNFGLSQLYQLRGRVGRGRNRAFCYLLIPQNKKLETIAEERLRILKENTSLGSGMAIAQHDLELRGSGTILGEEQSGAIENIGYEMYMELLNEAIKESRGEKITREVEPEINVRIKALIPPNYIPDLRLRLSYYKRLSGIAEETDIDRIEEDLRDQFGKPPEEVVNLMGLMIVRLICKKLHVKDLSSGKDVIALSFLDDTPLAAQKMVELSLMPNKKFSITPDNRLKIRMKEISWHNIYSEMEQLTKLI